MRQDLFPFVHAAHPFAPVVESFRAEVAQDFSSECLAHAEVKAVETPDGGWTVDRLYWSGQRFGGEFSARTLVYSTAAGRMTWFAFPHDPRLPHVECPPESRVLRYVPLRRLTLRTAHRATGRPVVAKFKRSSRLAESYQRLVHIADAVAAARTDFRVPTPKGIDASHNVFYQSLEAGDDLSTLLDEHTFGSSLQRLGEVHGELHQLHAPGLPLEQTDALQVLQRNVRWITFCEPRCADLMAASLRVALRAAPPPHPPLVCHGDLVCSQVLVDSDTWTLTDFDLCHRGDPYRDMAIVLASLPYDAPTLDAHAREEAANAYLEGYRRRANRRVDEHRLSWHLLAAEIYYLALGLTKSWCTPDQFERGLNRVRSAMARLEACRTAA